MHRRETPPRSRLCAPNPSRSALFLCSLGPSAFLRTRSTEDVGKTVVMLVAGPLENRTFTGDHRNACGPRFRERRRIGHGEFVHQRVWSGSREALDETHVLSRPSELAAIDEIGRLDNQRIPFPAAAGISHPGTDRRSHMGTTIQWNNPRLMENLVDDDKVSWSLDEPVIADQRVEWGVVGETWKHRRPDGPPPETALDVRALPR